MQMEEKVGFQLGRCYVDLARMEMRFNDQQRVSVQLKILTVLHRLAINYPNVVTRAELIADVWNGNEYVGQPALTNAVWQLRQIFEAHGERGSYIATFRKGGYQLLVQPEFETPEEMRLNAPVSQYGRSGTSNRAERRSYFFARMAARRNVLSLCALALLAIFAAWLVLNEHPRAVATAIPEQLTHSPGRELYPKLSHDGRSLAYVWVSPEGKQEIRVRSVMPGSDAEQTVHSSEYSLQSPHWINGDRALVFMQLSASENSCVIKEANLLAHEVKILIDCGSGALRKFTSSANGELLITSRDGKIVEHRYDGKSYNTLEPYCPSICNANQQIADLSLSPNGQSLLFSQQVSPLIDDVFLLQLNDRTVTQMTKGMVNIKGISWMPSQTQAVVSQQRAHRRHGVLFDIPSGRQHVLPINGFSSPHVASDNYIYFHHWVLHHHLGIINTNEAAGATPLLKSLYSTRCADYSAANQQLLYVSNETGDDQLWMSDLSGAVRTRLTYFSRQISCGRWSADGRRIVFTAQNEHFDDDALWVLNIENRSINLLKTDFRSPHRPTWSEAGDRIIVYGEQADGNVGLMSVNPENGKSLLLIKNAVHGFLGLDNTLWFTRSDQRGLWRVSIDRLAQTSLAVADCHSVFNWVVTKAKIFCEKRVRGKHEIWQFARFGDEAQRIAELPTGMIAQTGSFSFVHSSSQLIVTLDEPAESDIMRVAFQE